MVETSDFVPHGKHLIAGEWVAGSETFRSAPAVGEGFDISIDTPAHVERAAQAAEEAFWAYGYSSREDRAVFLEAIADEIDACGERITAIGSAETGLATARLETERGRTAGQLRLFANHIREGAYLDRRHDPALPERKPLPRSELHAIQRPIGPVAVFGASNFPLAFSTAGDDTAAALAAGCPVIVKGHEAHPGTSEVVAEAIDAAIRKTGMPAGTFSQIHGGKLETGQALVQHPLIKAVGFTGSFRGGRALFDLCAARPEPIPFFGELGSTNPMFVLPNALAARGAEVGAGWAGSLSMGVGQFCTKPGVAIGLAGPDLDAFAEATSDGLSELEPQTMLTDGIAAAFRSRRERIADSAAVEPLLEGQSENRNAAPALFRTTGDAFLADPGLAEEVFGPLGIVVAAKDEGQMVEIAHSLHGQLTATLHLDASDEALAARLMPILERKAGRLLANGFPTGVEVSDAMVHGGPYPASTNFGATSVGTLSIRRFLRPVCFQNMPQGLLPDDLK